MCESGNTREVRVKIAADLSCTGKSHWKRAKIDSCIADLVEALQRGGIDMRGSCCGHGKSEGQIELQDGRMLLILSAEAGRDYLSQDYSKSPNIEQYLAMVDKPFAYAHRESMSHKGNGATPLAELEADMMCGCKQRQRTTNGSVELMIENSLIAKADAAQRMARELGEETFALMGVRTETMGRLTPSCPPFEKARRTMVHLTNAALRLWELACLARAERLESVRADGREHARVATAEAPGDGPVGSLVQPAAVAPDGAQNDVMGPSVDGQPDGEPGGDAIQ